MSKEYTNIGLSEVRFYKYDDDGNELRDGEGNVVEFHAPDADFSHILPYLSAFQSRYKGQYAWANDDLEAIVEWNTK